MAFVRQARDSDTPLGVAFEQQVRSLLARELTVMQRRIRLAEVRVVVAH